jgi:hypothetical protein
MRSKLKENSGVAALGVAIAAAAGGPLIGAGYPAWGLAFVILGCAIVAFAAIDTVVGSLKPPVSWAWSYLHRVRIVMIPAATSLPPSLEMAEPNADGHLSVLSALQPEPPQSEQIDVDVDVAYLIGFFKGHTAIQASRSVEIFLGKWMTVSGELASVGTSAPAQVTFASNDHLYMYFRDPSEIARLALIPKGASITVRGRIEKVNPAWVDLVECQLG